MTIDISAFLEMPMPLQRRGIQLILNYLYNQRPSSLSAIHIDHVYSIICRANPSGKLDLPNGLKVIRSYYHCHFQFELKKLQKFRFELAQPGTLSLPDGGSIKLEYTDRLPALSKECCAFFNPGDVELPFMIRSREKGDKMSLKGMSGSKKLKDIFIDSKVPLDLRDRWPVVVDGKVDTLAAGFKEIST
ncbi:tRNA lysidine(34) synthetase TilS [Neobacillus sp. PS3-34]|uniref:tRNA lysidine(34) synthetase TilS n=1 Tax=Neobacillus sp. PS3-34 TaxID=3070678 RepID=UPI0035A5FA6C